MSQCRDVRKNTKHQCLNGCSFICFYKYSWCTRFLFHHSTNYVNIKEGQVSQAHRNIMSLSYQMLPYKVCLSSAFQMEMISLTSKLRHGTSPLSSFKKLLSITRQCWETQLLCLPVQWFFCIPARASHRGAGMLRQKLRCSHFRCHHSICCLLLKCMQRPAIC